jgi:ubiquinone/menaquinone biosynthesis C-methylase UbiE
VSDTPVNDLFMELFADLDRLGPGSEACTRRALEMVPRLPDSPRVLDVGCGSGASTKVLARALAGEILAIDLHDTFLRRLQNDLSDPGLRSRICLCRADMAFLPCVDSSFDLVWGEGSIYIVGFERALQSCRRLLKPGGALAVSELTWLVPDPPPQAVEYWNEEYPALTTWERNVDALRRCGYEPIGEFPLPDAAWRAYYDPLRERLADFRERHRGSADAEAIADSLQAELEIRDRFGELYSYVFYIATRC